jgi:uncharacterized protein (DUF2147 family)
MVKKKACMISLIVAAVFSLSMVYGQQSPVGMWKTVSDKDGKDTSWMQIWESNGKIFGKVVKLLQEPNDGKDVKCDKCPGNLKDKHIVGMTIMWNLKHDSGNTWAGGRIMDPDNGETYKCLIELQDNGNKLRVRGFIGISLLGRNQYWHKLK